MIDHRQKDDEKRHGPVVPAQLFSPPKCDIDSVPITPSFPDLLKFLLAQQSPELLHRIHGHRNQQREDGLLKRMDSSAPGAGEARNCPPLPVRNSGLFRIPRAPQPSPH